jgi:hypothetical protein
MLCTMRTWLLASLVVGLVLVAAPRVADACGSWRMVDTEKQLEIHWLVNSGTISKGKRRIGALYLDVESRDGVIKVVTSKKVVYDIKDGALRRYGKPVGRIEPDGTIKLGKRTFVIDFRDERAWHGEDKFRAWTLAATRDGTQILESAEASALCAVMHHQTRGKQLTAAEQRDEIRLRVAYYLMWRELGT